MRRNRPNSSSGKHHGGGSYIDYDDGDFGFLPPGPKPKKPPKKQPSRGGFRGRGGDRGGGSDSGRGRGGERGRGGGRGGNDSGRGRGGDRGRGRGGDRGRGRGNNSSAQGNGYPGSASRGRGIESRVKMQQLHMSNENQDMVRDMLFAIRKADLEDRNIDSFGDEMENGKDDDFYDDEDYFDDVEEDEDDNAGQVEYDDKQYWMAEKNLEIEDSVNYAEMNPEEISKHQYTTMNNQFAIQRLMRCGFHKSRCEEALFLLNDDIGAALDYLLCECFEMEYSPVTEGHATQLPPEISDARSEEIMVLKGIYEDKFEERLRNKIWILHLDLPHLVEMSKNLFDINTQSGSRRARSHKETEKDKRPLCKYFSSKSGCRMGSKCKFRHELKKEAPQMAEGIAGPLQEAETPKQPFQLEIRLQEGNKYPQEPPLVVFSSTLDYFPSQSALNITRHLFHEAKQLAEFHSPAVFNIVSLLEEDNTIMLSELLQQKPCVSSLPRPIISMKQYQHMENVEKEMEKMSTPEDITEQRTKSGTASMLKMADRDEERASNSKKTSKEHRPKDHAVKRGVKSTSPAEHSKLNKKLKEDFMKKIDTKNYKDRQTSRAKLPAWDMKDKILKILEENQVTVISGMTGCGKTTQVPQFILESYLNEGKNNMCNIICTQPRRISAIAVAQRVAQEQVDKIGKLVGYQIRLENIQSASTRLLFCTTGIILRRLEGDPMLEGVTHLIIDEVHERTEESDFLMMILKDLLPKRRNLKIILMSATLNAELFSTYFGNCPTVDIPGKTFPVEQFFLEDAVEFTRYILEDTSQYARPIQKANAHPQFNSFTLNYDDLDMQLQSIKILSTDERPSDKKQDQNLTTKQLIIRYQDYGKKTIRSLAMMDMEKINYDLIVELLEWIINGEHKHAKGAVLIFLPGFAEITTLFELLQGNPEFGSRNKHKYKIIPLHSTLSSEDQNAVFLRPKDGVTKIVIATNIAETSITIDDVVYVIDAGRMKEKRYDASKGMESLDTVWVSRANALQRKGRAGRVTHGVCFHLFTRNRFEFHLRSQPIPEIQRAPLEGICLKIKMLELFKGGTIEKVLQKLLEPPKDESITSAIKRLQDLGALDESIELTPLGYHLGSLPVDPRIGKLMLFGAIFRCLCPALTIAATLSYQSPFITPFGKKEEATEKKCQMAVGNSDHLTMVKAYNEWMKAKERSGHEAYQYCRDNFLSSKNLQMLTSLKQQFVELLSDIGFVQTGITMRDVERAGSYKGDGVKEITGPEANINSGNWRLMSAILVGALYPNVVQVLTPEARYIQSSAGAVLRDHKAKELKFKTKPDGYVHIHPSSVNFQVNYYESPYLVYHEKVKTSRIYVRDCTMVSVYPLLLFGGASISIDLQKGNFVMSVDDGWIRFMVTKHEIAELVRELRKELDQLLSDKINDPNMDLCTCPRGSSIIATIVKLITTQ